MVVSTLMILGKDVVISSNIWSLPAGIVIRFEMSFPSAQYILTIWNGPTLRLSDSPKHKLMQSHWELASPLYLATFSYMRISVIHPYLDALSCWNHSLPAFFTFSGFIPLWIGATYLREGVSAWSQRTTTCWVFWEKFLVFWSSRKWKSYSAH